MIFIILFGVGAEMNKNIENRIRLLHKEIKNSGNEEQECEDNIDTAL